MEAGLAPGQVRKGLRMMSEMVGCWDAFFDRLGYKFYFLEPLGYNSAILYERAGFQYLKGKEKMVWVDREFRPGGLLRERLDGSTPFRRPSLALTVRGRRGRFTTGSSTSRGKPQDVQKRRRARGRRHLYRGEILIPARLLPVALLLVVMLPGAASAQDGEDPPGSSSRRRSIRHRGRKAEFLRDVHRGEGGHALEDLPAERAPHSGPVRGEPQGIPAGQPEGRRPVADHAGPESPRSVRRKTEDDGRRKTVDYVVMRGDSLSKILFPRDVPRREWKKYLDAVREINASVAT